MSPTAFGLIHRADYNHSGDWERMPEPSLGARIQAMPILWLRVALGCYAVGLLYALVALTRTSDLLNKIALHAAYLGMVFHFVSLTDSILLTGQLALTSVHNAESVLGFLIMVVFMLVYLLYQTTSPGIVIFPLVFLLTFVAATGQQPFLFTSPGLRTGWLFAHIALIFTGYAALILSFGASLLYLIQERSLKAKRPGIFSSLPALQVIDEFGFRSLLLDDLKCGKTGKNSWPLGLQRTFLNQIKQA